MVRPTSFFFNDSTASDNTFMKKLKMDVEISKKEREVEINYSTPVKNNRSGDRFINSKRERELSSAHNSITNLNLNVQFNKIN